MPVQLLCALKDRLAGSVLNLQRPVCNFGAAYAESGLRLGGTVGRVSSYKATYKAQV